MRAEARPLGVLLLSLTLASCGGAPPPPSAAPYGRVAIEVEDRRWVDSVLVSLSDRERVAQMVVEWIPGAYASPSSPEFRSIARWVAEDRIGGVSPSIGSPLAYAAKLNALQSEAEIPLLVASDFENGGPGMRINGAYALPSLLPQGGGTAFPPTMAFGAIGDERFAFEYGRITALEARAIGVHLLFAPVLDVNSNPDNPVIATRSFGGDPALVARLGTAFIRGARAGGAFATGKHFPGHGDTSVDSHLGIPVIEADRARLDSLELVPFHAAIEGGVDAIMTAHVQLPGIAGPGAPPATLSEAILTGLLRAELGFDGLVLTDALTMRGITDAYGIQEASIRAVEAGADVILSPRAVTEVIDAVAAAVESGRLSRARIESSVRRILEMKASLGLHRDRMVELDRVDRVVGSGAHLAFADSAASRSITLVRDRAGIVPLSRGAQGRSVHLRFAPSTWLWAGRAFSEGLVQRLPDLREIALDERSDSLAYQAAAAAVAGADRVIVSAYLPPSAGAGPDALPAPLRDLVAGAVARVPTVLLSLGSPYLLHALPEVESYLVAWGDREMSQRAALRALFGEEAISGRLPIDLPPYHRIGEGLDRAKVAERGEASVTDDPLVAAGIAPERTGGPVSVGSVVADPTALGVSVEGLARVDSIMRVALADSAASGMALAVGRHGRLVLLQGYGELAYGSGRATTPTSLFDLASVTKAVATTTALMILASEGRLELDAPVVRYLPWWGGDDARKTRVTVRHLLLHRSGLPAFRPWYTEHSGLDAYRRAVAAEPLEAEPGSRTLYSDLGAMTLGWIVEEVGGRSLDDFLRTRVWAPLGMEETGFRPAPSLRPRIAATELDTLWRHELVWGRVHDENAEAMGGVAGHAGLFSTALDLSVLAAVLLEGGRAGPCVPGEVLGEPCPARRTAEARITDARTIETFTTRPDGATSRALGWDTSGGADAPAGLGSRAFGHSGFTGTSLWMDPELDLWVVLLTNRVHPTRENTKHLALRRAVHAAVLRAVQDAASDPASASPGAPDAGPDPGPRR